jgi:hypothetical protein
MELDRDLGFAALRASLSDRPLALPIDEMLDNGVSGLGTSLDDLLVLS